MLGESWGDLFGWLKKKMLPGVGLCGFGAYHQFRFNLD